jgi:hypothetical protein
MIAAKVHFPGSGTAKEKKTLSLEIVRKSLIPLLLVARFIFT